MAPGITIEIKENSLFVMPSGGIMEKPSYLSIYGFTIEDSGVLEGLSYKFNTLEYALRDADYVLQWRA